MKSWMDLLNEPMIERLGWTLVHFLWEGAVVAALFALTLLIMRKRSANARYVAGCMALLLLAAVPVATFIALPRESVVVSVSDTPTASPPPRFPTSPATRSSPRTATITHTNESPSAMAVTVRFSELLAPVLPWFVTLWMAGVFFMSARLLISWLRVRRMKTDGTETIGDDWERKLAEFAQRIGVSRPVRLLKSSMAEVPTVIGWLRPVILMPASTLTGLSQQQIEAILAHELAHIRRHDYLVNLLQSVVETLLFYHPAVWWISNRVRQEREHCCDDWALKLCGDRVAYARALATLEELRQGSDLALAARGGSLLSRIRRIVGQPDAGSNRSAWWLASAIALIAIVAILLFLRTPIVAEDEKKNIESVVSSKDIHEAAIIGDVERVKELLKKNPDLVHAKNEQGQTPLVLVTSSTANISYVPVAGVLLSNGADVNSRSKGDLTPLHWAIINQQSEMVDLLLKHKADVQATDIMGATPLFRAASGKDKSIIEKLLESGADISTHDQDGSTLLHEAASQGHREIVELFLAKRADINAKSDGGFTPLHAAANRGQKEIVELLLAHKADPTIRDGNGRTALTFAIDRGYKEIAELLREQSKQDGTKRKSSGNPKPQDAPRGAEPPKEGAQKEADKGEVDEREQAINKKIRAIIIPKIDFNHANIKKVLQTLQEASKEHDLPNHEGVKIALKGDAEKQPESVPVLTIKLTNVPLNVALDYITQASDLTYKINARDGGVEVRSVTDADGKPKKQSAIEVEKALNETQAIRKKLESIIIPKIKFTEADIKSILDTVVQSSKDQDAPTHEGVNIILNLIPEAFVAPPSKKGVPPPVPLVPFLEPPGVKPVTMELNQVSLGEALKKIADAAGLKMRIEPQAVVLDNTGEIGLVTKTYRVIDEKFTRDVLRAQGGEKPMVTPESVKKYFETAGVKFPSGASVTYARLASVLIVTNTEENIEVFERILEIINK